MTKPSPILVCPVVSRPRYKPPVKHGFAAVGKRTRTYRIWNGMMSRCYCQSSTSFPRYGGRGISVCDRWHEFLNFLNDMGEAQQGMSIERIDNNGNYEPNNCRWATTQEQNENRSNVRWIEFNGERLTLTGWSKKVGINKTTMAERLAKWPLAQALGFEQRPPQVHIPPEITPESRKKMSDAAKARCARNGGKAIP